MKKLTSILLTMLIIISALPIHITAKAEEKSEQTPEYVSYQAKRYSDSFTMYLDNSASYARRYYNIMKEKESVISGIAVWESAHIATDLSYAMDTGLISKRDMYQIAIFDMLGVSDSNEYIDKAFESMNSSRFWGRMSITKSLLKSETIRSDDLKTLPISSEIIDFIKNDSDTIDEFFEEADMVKSVVDVGKTIYEAIDTIASYHAMCEMRDGTVDILNAIATDSENPWDLRLAASECVKHFNVGYEKALNSILNSEQVLSDAIIRKSVEILFEEAWGALIKAIPGATFVMAFAKGYRVLSNEIFKMDDTCKTYYQFCAAVELEEAVHRVMVNMKNDFRENYDIQKASLYMRSVELYENIVLKGYDYTIDMLEIKATAPVTKWADWLDHEYGECMELIEGAETAKSNKRSIYKQYEDWIKNDYKKKYYPDYNDITDTLNKSQETFEYTIINNTATITKYSGSSSDLIIPSKINGYRVTEIGSFVFSLNRNLESITIPDSVISIGAQAFNNCTELVDVKLSNSLKKIEDLAFGGCSKLKSIIIPENVDYIGDRAFLGCISIETIVVSNKNITFDSRNNCNAIIETATNELIVGCKNTSIPNDINIIGSYTFSVNRNPSVKIYLPDSIKRIESYAFYGNNFTSITIPSSVTSIGANSFRDSQKLTYIEIPDSVNQIENWTFANCKNMSGIKIPNTLKSIGDFAFWGCSSLNRITIPYNVTSIGESAFYGCSDDFTIYGYKGSFAEQYAYANKYKFIAIDNHNHAFSELSRKKASCIDEGQIKSICSVCGEVKIERIPLTNHVITNVIIIRPTCIREGYTSHICGKCGYSYDDSFVNATDEHSFENGICKVCGHPDIKSLNSVTINEPYVVNINNNGQIKYYKFTPKQNGTLHFYSSGSYDTYGYLYNTEMNLLTSKDSGAEDNNFNIDYDVFAGQTYLLACRMYSFEIVGEFIISVNFVPDEVLIGDTNKDGIISISDVTTIQRHLAGIETFTDEQLALADTDGDGEINIIDATHLQKYLAEFDGIVLGKKAT